MNVSKQEKRETVLVEALRNERLAELSADSASAEEYRAKAAVFREMMEDYTDDANS